MRTLLFDKPVNILAFSSVFVYIILSLFYPCQLKSILVYLSQFLSIKVNSGLFKSILINLNDFWLCFVILQLNILSVMSIFISVLSR